MQAACHGSEPVQGRCFPRMEKTDLSKCPDTVKRIAYKEMSKYVVDKKLSVDNVVYRVDTDQNGKDEYICLFHCLDSKATYLAIEGGSLLAKYSWLEMNKTEVMVVSMVKKGEAEILLRRPGGGAGFDSADIAIYKKQGNGYRQIFTGDYFLHSWHINEPDHNEGKYYSLAGEDPPYEILQYEGELDRTYNQLPKYRPDFVTVKSGLKPQKVFVWDEAKFKYVEKK